jgi:hypothetical protein
LPVVNYILEVNVFNIGIGNEIEKVSRRTLEVKGVKYNIDIVQ